MEKWKYLHGFNKHYLRILYMNKFEWLPRGFVSVSSLILTEWEPFCDKVTIIKHRQKYEKEKLESQPRKILCCCTFKCATASVIVDTFSESGSKSKAEFVSDKNSGIQIFK